MKKEQRFYRVRVNGYADDSALNLLMCAMIEHSHGNGLPSIEGVKVDIESDCEFALMIFVGTSNETGSDAVREALDFADECNITVNSAVIM
jgi:hypothetical protein